MIPYMKRFVDIVPVMLLQNLAAQGAHALPSSCGNIATLLCTCGCKRMLLLSVPSICRQTDKAVLAYALAAKLPAGVWGPVVAVPLMLRELLLGLERARIACLDVTFEHGSDCGLETCIDLLRGCFVEML
jgi:hypothetical protein